MSNKSHSNQCTIKAPANAHFLFKHWDEECVLYNNLSGETHLLEKTCADLISTIHQKPTDYQSLLDMLITTYKETTTDEAIGYLDQTLAHLQELELLELEED